MGHSEGRRKSGGLWAREWSHFWPWPTQRHSTVMQNYLLNPQIKVPKLHNRRGNSLLCLKKYDCYKPYFPIESSATARPAVLQAPPPQSRRQSVLGGGRHRWWVGGQALQDGGWWWGAVMAFIMGLIRFRNEQFEVWAAFDRLPGKFWRKSKE